MATAKAPELVSYADACVRLKISKRTLQPYVSRGVFGKARLGKNSYVFADEIDAYFEGLAKGNGEANVRAYRVKQGRIKR